jgi:hypothetical protein
VIFAKLAPAESCRNLAPPQPFGSLLPQVLLFVKPGEHGLLIVGKAAFMLLLAAYGIRLIFTPIVAFPSTSVWLHAVNLVFHEAGHVLFMPFGRFLQVLGGSLGQLLVPAVVIGAFLRRHDTYGAAVGTWWLGESLLDLAPYINDARAGQLMLLGGVTGSEVEDYHDWELLLTKLSMLPYDHALARMAHTTGTLLMLSALFWGCRLLWKSWQQRIS